MATFPKPYMKVSELVQMGFDRQWLQDIAKTKCNTFAFKQGSAKNSHLIFDTEKFQRYLDRQIERTKKEGH